ncbi:FecR family protein [Aureibacter tunicatorum]|uniref:Ferric-dicitrate binding protein FerR (Iron transport regulator) n=1 Tax=Aureibacter tunicatorum TaxID=866807 RepID=A0AAE3XQX6_9BACT|nr:FecR domain-containing protein [Aureibacter tunicatorum]MDR6240286.1 ferric-dicitrate binding protein FerR (iron transport regulator) [Aureibacter tunicatorum]BDD05833.1 hypothetical protein AUTU_33160 [Aureibacter tunicatorum]
MQGELENRDKKLGRHVEEALRGGGMDLLEQHEMWREIDRATENKKRFSLRTMYQLAASVAFVMLGSWLIWYQLDKTQEVQTYIVKENIPGTRTVFDLPDGSTVKLIGKSAIKYREGFSEELRRVELLYGTGYFDVAKDKNRPFIAYSDEVDVKVLGTKFILANRDKHTNTKVLLESGEVLVKNKITEGFKMLKPGQYFEIYKNQIDKVGNLKEEELSWTRDVLVLENADAKTLVKQIEDWYGVRVTTVGMPKKKIVMSGSLKSLTLRETLDGLGFKYDIKDNGDVTLVWE